MAKDIVKTKEKKEKKPKKEAKKFPAKKMPGMFKKSYSEKKLESKILNRLYVPADKKDVKSLFEKGANAKKPELMAMSREKTFTKAELKHYTKLAKEIKKQKSIFSFVPFVAVVAVFVGIGLIVSIFKNPVTKKALVWGCQKAAGAKTEIRSVNLEIFGTSLTVNGIAIGNKNEEFKNLFEAEKIEVAFSLSQALRGRFDCKNIEVSGMQFNTDRKTSCKLITAVVADKIEESENANSEFMTFVKEKKENAISGIKAQAQAMLGGATPEEMAANLESKLKTPVAAKEAKEQAEVMVAKWKDKPEEVKKQIEDFSNSVKALQNINPSSIKDVTELKATLEKLNSAISKSREVKKSVSSLSDEVKADSKTVAGLGTSVKNAVAEDKKFVEDTVGTAVNTVKNAKSIMNNALEAVAMDKLGKYYPYAKKGLAYVESMKSSSSDAKKEKPKAKKEKKAKKEGRKRLRGTTFWYGTTKPSFLIERIFASGPDFEAKVTDVSNDMELLGKPMKGEGKFSRGNTLHNANFVVDTRTSSKANLITANYTGKGFGAKIDGASIASASGIPSIDGTAAITVKCTFDFDGFAANGEIDLNPVKLVSDGIGNETASKYYNMALASVSRLKAGYRAGYSAKNGIDLALSGNFGDQFAKALSSVVSEIGSEAKAKAVAKLNEKINCSSNEAFASVKKFAGIEGDINAQNVNLASVQNILDSKKAQVEKEIKNRAANAVTNAVGDKVSGSAKDVLKSLNKLKK